MSKIIKLTDEFKNICVSEFQKALSETKLADGKLSFVKTFDYHNDVKAEVLFTAKAWVKQLMLLNNFDKEVAWHGVAKRYGDENEHRFIIEDIIVYPQEVTAATVNTDQEKYQTWLMSQPDEVFNNIRMQGHSHVYMGTSPSSVDLAHQEAILEQLEDDMFYIFMIFNKKLERTIKIYDLKNNILFEDKDITVLGADGDDIFEFISSAKELVKNKSYPTYTDGYSQNYKKCDNKCDGSGKSGKTKQKKSNKPMTKASETQKVRTELTCGSEEDEDLYYGYGRYGQYYY